MAKKKDIKNTTQTNVVKQQKEENMKSKVEIKKPERNSQEKISRLVGSIFIGLGVLLVAFGIYSFIRFREEPVLDIDLEAPVLTEVTSLTSGDKIQVRGEAPMYDDVYIYINDVKVGSSKVGEDDNFSYEYVVDEQGEYSVTVAGVKGFPNRVMGPRSETKIATVDWTDPDVDSVTLKYGEETNKDTFVMAGVSEPLSTITVKRGILSYSTIANAQGEYRLEGIELEEGKNVFTVSIKDQAGNEVTLEEKVRVTYSPMGDINGDAVVDGNIPQASGEFDTLIGNQIMMMFGAIALVAFGSSMVVMYNKRR
ncbi:MAG: hypothetical protein WC981_00925 [Candidatus Dojkabacteria bacterium]